MRILVGCEESQAVCKAFRKLGHEAYSCDILPASGGHPEWHLQMDVFEAINLHDWDLGVFFPDCTYLTVSAEWAYKDPDYARYPRVGYHQRIKGTTLVGEARRFARVQALQFVRALMNAPIPRIAIENPVGCISSRIRKPDQIIQPHQFGDDASKATCLWLKNLPALVPTNQIAPRWVGGKPRWGNQTDGGQNKLAPSKNRASIRSKTYSGIAEAMANQWTEKKSEKK